MISLPLRNGIHRAPRLTRTHAAVQTLSQIRLLPPQERPTGCTVATASKCPNGVAKVETRLSFVNQLVAWLTGYIYTPMSIKATCAESRRASVSAPRIDVGADPTAEQVKNAISRAAELSLRDGVPVYIEY